MNVPVTVILPTAGRPQLATEALLSIYGGTLLPSEIHVVFDSPDPVMCNDEQQAVMKAWHTLQHHYDKFNIDEKKRTRLHTHTTGGQGVAAARNIGAEAASSEWIAFLDSDDLWHPDKLNIQMSYLKKRPHLHACQTLEEWERNGKKIHIPLRLTPGCGSFFKDSLDLCLVACSSLVIKRKTFLDLGGFDVNFPVCEDYDFWIRYLFKHPMGLVQQPLSVKRAGDWRQLSKNYPRLDLYRIKSLCKNRRSLLLSDEQNKMLEEALLKKWNILYQGAVKHQTLFALKDIYEELSKEKFFAQNIGLLF